MKILNILLLLFLTSCPLIGQETEKEKNWSLTGYIKNLQSAVFFNSSAIPSPLLDNLFHQRFNFKQYYGDNWKFQAGMRNRLFLGETVKANPDYASRIDQGGNDILDLSFIWLDKEGVVGHSIIDRAFVEYSKGDWEFRVGRQRINWGISSIWNPNDIFNAFSFTDFDYEERPGSDAVLLRKYTGYASSLELAFKLTADPDDAVLGLLWKFNKGSYDFQLLSAYHKNDFVLGGGWAGNIKNGSLKGEWSWFVPFEDDSQTFSGTIGYEYQFENSLFLSVGYLFNSLGNKSGNILELFNFELSAKNLYPYKHSSVIATNFQISPLIAGGASFIYSPNQNHPLFISPNLLVSVAENWDLSLTGQLVFSKLDKFTSPLQAFYLRLKYSF